LQVKSGAAVNLGPPPAHSDKKESPIVEKLRRLSLKGVAHELEHPARDEKRQGVPPQAVEEKASYKQSE